LSQSTRLLDCHQPPSSKSQPPSQQHQPQLQQPKAMSQAIVMGFLNLRSAGNECCKLIVKLRISSANLRD
jgi:hypothetical protein